MAQKYLFEGKHEAAVPAALHSLRFRMDVHGLSSVELVPAYLLLAEASLGKRIDLRPPPPSPLRSTILGSVNSLGNGTEIPFRKEQCCCKVWHKVGKRMSSIFGYY